MEKALRHSYDRCMLIPKEFDEFYEEIYKQRWAGIKAALLAPEAQVARKNGFAKDIQSWDAKGEIPRATNGVLSYYIMDPASIFAAKALQVEAGHTVLDMCAAPGGKTLILAEALPQQLIANELSAARRERLKKVLQQYIPREQRENIFLNGKDGGKFALTHADKFDRVLVDAPCSGERHLLKNSEELSEWSPKRSKKLALRQYALMTAALITAKPGARIVYSTCALSPFENDDVIAELLRRKPGSFELVQDSVSAGESTQYGRLFLPDSGQGGPIYYAILQRTAGLALV